MLFRSPVVLATQLGAIERLLQAAEFDFNSPPHFVELEELFGREIRRLQNAREQADLETASTP